MQGSSRIRCIRKGRGNGVPLKQCLHIGSSLFPMLYVVLLRIREHNMVLLLPEGRTVVKCICECNQSGRRVVFNPLPLAMSAAHRVEW